MDLFKPKAYILLRVFLKIKNQIKKYLYRTYGFLKEYAIIMWKKVT